MTNWTACRPFVVITNFAHDSPSQSHGFFWLTKIACTHPCLLYMSNAYGQSDTAMKKSSLTLEDAHVYSGRSGGGARL